MIDLECYEAYARATHRVPDWHMLSDVERRAWRAAADAAVEAHARITADSCSGMRAGEGDAW